MSDDREILSVFAATEDGAQWVEYTILLTHTAKTTNPIDINATLAWRSNFDFAAGPALRGSFGSRELALAAVRSVVEEGGRKLQRMTRKRLRVLEEKFNYPAGRNSCLLAAPVIQPRSPL